MSKDIFTGRETDKELVATNMYAKKFLDFLNEYYLNDKIATKLTYFGCYKSFILPPEQAKSKFAYDFTTEECKNLLESINTNNKRVYKLLKTLLDRYNNWAIVRGFNPTGINPMDEISLDILTLPKDLAKKRYISKEDLFDKCDKIIESGFLSPQYTIIWILGRHGILGKNLTADMLNLTVDNIDFENKKVHYTSEAYGEVNIDVDERFINSIIRAITDGDYSEYSKSKDIFKDDLQYILKSPRNKEKPITEGVLRNRLCKLNKIVRDSYTLSDLELCCKIDKLKEIKQNKGKLTINDFKEVQKCFGKSINSYPLLKEDYELITGDTDIEIITKRIDTSKFVVRKINGKHVTNIDLGISKEEMEKKYPTVLQRRTKKWKQKNRDK